MRITIIILLVVCACSAHAQQVDKKLQNRIAEAVKAVRAQSNVVIGIHTHNDAGLAVANALSAVLAGSDHAQGTINGVGERCGNMDLTTLVANLQLKYHLDCLRPGTLQHLTEVSRYVYETANYNLVSGQPYVASSAFAHKGGMHVHAVQKDASTYEHVSPEEVGNTRKIIISELSGASNIAAKAGKDMYCEKPCTKNIAQSLTLAETMRHTGRVFQAGTQRRNLPHFAFACELARTGKLGKLKAFTPIRRA